MDAFATSSASVRSATPTSPDPAGQYLRLPDNALLHVPHGVELGVGAQVIQADLILKKADTWTAGTYSFDVYAIDAQWDPATVTFDTLPALRTTTVVNESLSGGGAAGDEVTWDVTPLVSAAVAEEDAAGERWYGLLIDLGGSTEVKFFSAYASPEMRPLLRVVQSRPPIAPFDLQPSAGRSVSQTKPELVARFADPDEDNVISAMRVEISTDDTFDTVLYDSGFVSVVAPRFDLADPPTGSPATPTLSTATTYYWRAYVEDNHGVESPVSETASFVVTTKAALTLTSPATSSVTSPVPTFTWTYADQEQVEVEVEKRIGGIWVDHWMLPQNVSSVLSATLPDDYALQEGIDYRVTVRGWDDVTREDLPGDRAFVEDSQAFSLAPVSV